MILISHRGNTNGKNLKLENSIEYIEQAITMGYEVEVDIWIEDGKLYTGHDSPVYETSLDWIFSNKLKLWLHCKNIDALEFLKNTNSKLNYFWHQNDDVTITSLGYFWTYPGKKLTKNSICVLPELLKSENINISAGICSDFISLYKD